MDYILKEIYIKGISVIFSTVIVKNYRRPVNIENSKRVGGLYCENLHYSFFLQKDDSDLK